MNTKIIVRFIVVFIFVLASACVKEPTTKDFKLRVAGQETYSSHHEVSPNGRREATTIECADPFSCGAQGGGVGFALMQPASVVGIVGKGAPAYQPPNQQCHLMEQGDRRWLDCVTADAIHDREMIPVSIGH